MHRRAHSRSPLRTQTAPKGSADPAEQQEHATDEADADANRSLRLATALFAVRDVTVGRCHVVHLHVSECGDVTQLAESARKARLAASRPAVAAAAARRVERAKDGGA